MREKDRFGLPHRPGETVFMAAFLLFSLFLLSQLTAETKFSARGKFFAQPRVWPAIGVGGMALFSALHLWRRGRFPDAGALGEVGLWLRGIEYLLWFMAYVWAVPVVGYLPATLLFTCTLAWRVGYRSPRGQLAAAVTGLAVVLVFKTALSVKIPGGALYEMLPGWLRNVMILYF